MPWHLIVNVCLKIQLVLLRLPCTVTSIKLHAVLLAFSGRWMLGCFGINASFLVIRSYWDLYRLFI